MTNRWNRPLLLLVLNSDSLSFLVFYYLYLKGRGTKEALKSREMKGGQLASLSFVSLDLSMHKHSYHPHDQNCEHCVNSSTNQLFLFRYL